MLPVLPTHFRGRQSGWTDNGSMSNVALRIGEVQAIYYPGDEHNDSGRFVEYDVRVGHRANGTAVTRMYNHVIAIDHYGSVADYSFATYRVQQTSTNEDVREEGGARELAGLGSKVILLCINGESNNAVIIGGVRDYRGVRDQKADAHHLRTVFNGIDWSVNKDGEWTLTYNGATKLDGEPRDDVDPDTVGTVVKVTKDGNFLVSDGAGDNRILIDRVKGKVQVLAAEEIGLAATAVRLGDLAADDPSVKGNELKDVLTDLIDAIKVLTVTTAEGPSSVPNNIAQFSAISARLQSILSDTVFLK